MLVRRVHSAALVGLLLLAACAVRVQADFSTPVYPLNFTYAGAVTSSSRTHPGAADVGTCICDMSFNDCDYNCQCDSDCSADERGTFTTSLNEGPVKFGALECTDSNLMRINSRGNIHATVLDHLLCVKRKREPDYGDFFSYVDPPLSSAKMISLKSAETYTFEDAVDDSVATLTTASTSTTYAFDQPLSFATGTSGALLKVGQGYFVVPGQSGFGPLCEDTKYARFGRDVGYGSLFHQSPHSNTAHNALGAATQASGAGNGMCIRAVVDPATECDANGKLSAARFASTRYWVGKRPSALLSAGSEWAQVSVRSLYRKDSATGSLTDLGATGTSTVFPTPSLSTSPCVCTDALLEVLFEISYNSTGVIDSVDADVVIGSVTSETCGLVDDATLSTVGGSAVSQAFAVTQVFQTKFTLAHQTSTSTVVARPKSGAPGYHYGLPVLAGSSAASGAASGVRQSRFGLSLLPYVPIATGRQLAQSLGGSGGRGEGLKIRDGMGQAAETAGGVTRVCVSASSSASGVYMSALQNQDMVSARSTVFHPVLYGVDGIFSCGLLLTDAELQSLCTAGSYNSYLYFNATHLGVWGDSDYRLLVDSEWTSVSVTAPANPSWDATTTTCQGLATSLHLEIFTQSAGSELNPQQTIVGARAYYGTEDVAHTYGGYVNSLGATTNTNATQMVEMRATVTFISRNKNGDVERYVPDAPFPKLPQDLLYPLFLDSPGGPSALRSGVQGVLYTAVLLLCMLAVLARSRGF